jgi:hypothetical protein
MVLAVGLISAACDKFNVPRFSHEPAGGPVAPISVRVVLDQQLQNAILTQPVCDNQLWEGHIAEVLTHSIQDAGRTRFKATQVVAASETAAPSELPADYQVLLRLVNKDFVAKDRTGSTDQYMARIDLDLAATYQAVLPDGTLRTMGEGPLRYSDNLSIFTPRIGQAGGRCLTGELDGTLTKASRALTDQLFAVVAQLPAGGPSPVAGAATGSGGVAVTPQPAGAAPVILRVTLLDDNNNHILEPGEKIGLRVDVTNTGAGAITHAPLSLGGTPALIDAFTQSGAGSPDLGPINPGATKGMVLWGKMPSSVATDRGELTLSLTPSWIDQRGAAATSAPVGQTLVAAIRSGGSSLKEGQQLDRSSVTPPQTDNNRFALVVGVRQYRDPWPGADAKPAVDPARLVVSLQRKLGVPKDHLMLLEDELANRLDIEEALTRWLPERIGRETVLFVYFVGHTTVDAQSGEVYLVPYDAAPDAPFYRFLPLRRLHSHMNQLDAKLSLVFIDGSQSRINSTSASTTPSKSKKPATPVSPNWQGALDGTSNGKGLVIQFSRRESQQPSQADYFLAGLDGQSDLNQDGQVTVGELLRSLKGRAVTVPLVSASSPELSIVLSR